MRHSHAGQALALVALVIAILVSLIVGVNEVALRRQTQSRIQESLDQAAAAAVVQLNPASLVSNRPDLIPDAAEVQFRTALRAGLRRIAFTVTDDPAVLAEQAHVRVIAAGGKCGSRTILAPAICADLTVTIASVLGDRTMTFTTLAQAARQQ
jgi:hypothetical protein